MLKNQIYQWFWIFFLVTGVLKKKITFFLLFWLLCCSFYTTCEAQESPETIEKIRTFLKEQADLPRKKKHTTDKVGVAFPTLIKFIEKDDTLQLRTFQKIIKEFKDKYPEKYQEFTASLATGAQIQAVPSSQPLKAEPERIYPCLDLCALPVYSSFPDTYSLLMVDSALTPSSSISNWEKHITIKDVGVRYLRPSLSTDNEISFSPIEQESQLKKKWILKTERKVDSPTKQQQLYYIIQLFKKRETSRTASLISSLTSGHTTAYNGFDFQAALIIFPHSSQKSMVYGFGSWDSLLNPACIVPQWGLRTLTSGQICNPDKVKAVDADHYRNANSFTRRERAAALQAIEVFGLEVGSEELKKVTLMPNKAVRTTHVLEGQDYIQFTVITSENATLEQTVQSLECIATYFFNVTTATTFHVHSRMKEFIDDEITSSELIQDLNGGLQELLRSQHAKEYFFLHDSFWKEMKGKKVSFGDNKKHSIFDVFSQLQPQDPSPQTIKVWAPRLEKPKEFDVTKILYSLPFEHCESFYRFDRGRWYQVDLSRFERIKRIMRERKQPSSILQLPDYSHEDTERSQEEKKADYKEAKYNLRAVQTINKVSGCRAILLDRINVSLGKAGDKFEFADLLIINNGNFYIVHIKRAEASALSHHREQVERSADFLACELKKDNAHELLLQGVINGLYENNGLPIKKEKSQGKRITKGSCFLNLQASGGNIMLVLQAPPVGDLGLKIFIEQVLRIIAKDGLKECFEKYPDDFVSALDALSDCVIHKQSHFTDGEMDNFLRAVQQTILAREVLFPNGLLKKSDLEKIKIILAVIDDRAVDATSKEKQSRPQPFTFKNQDLWGLDRTRTMVEKTGLGFGLMVINETPTEAWDAFGPVIRKERRKFAGTTGDEPECVFAPSSAVEEPQEKLTKENLKRFLEQTETSTNPLNVMVCQKLQYTDGGRTIEYYTCPTVGDGDCFFHAAFTDAGDNMQTVRDKAADLRRRLCDAVQEGQYLDTLRDLVYEHYLGLLAHDLASVIVPEDIKRQIREKDDYSSMYNSMQHFGITTEGVLTPEEKFSENSIKDLITPDNIKGYMEQFRTVGGSETYIPVRPHMICPAHILATLGNKTINIFTFNSSHQRLEHLKTVGTEGIKVDILLEGSHFLRIYDPSKDENYKHECEQIMKNQKQLLY